MSSATVLTILTFLLSSNLVTSDVASIFRYDSITVAIITVNQVTCDVSNLLGYEYPPPQQPPLFDEPSTPSNMYLPPIFQDEVIPPVPIPTYLPPVFYPPLNTPPSNLMEDDTVVIPPPTPGSLYQTPTPQMKILNMSCVLDTSFKTRFRLERRGGISPAPVLENGGEGCIQSDSSNTFSIDMEGRKRLGECGVRRCASGSSSRANMCVMVRMPTVRGIKLPEDGLVTMQCTPQDAVVSHTKHISLSPTASNKGRSAASGVVASGGSQRNFDSRIILMRKSNKNGNFDQPLQPGSVVLLGEELVLRAVVQDGDGWKFSRMGPVLIRSPVTQKSVTLVEDNGCRSPAMRSVCPYQPRQLSPLDTVLHFRAFLFQGSSRGEDMLLSVRMLGCVHSQDCQQSGTCSEEGILPPLRFKRGAKGIFSADKNATNDWETQFEFRVQVPEETKGVDQGTSVSREFLILASMLGFCLLFIAILIAVYFTRNNSHQWT